MSLDFKPTNKKMKKRKELDALVSADKIAKFGSGGSGGGVVRKSSRTHQLLEESGSNSENDIQQELSGEADLFAQVTDRRFRRRQRGSCCDGCESCGRTCFTCLGICSFILCVVSIVGVAAVAWMQMEMKREMALLRDTVHRVTESDGGVAGDLVKLRQRLDTLDVKVASGAGAVERLGDAATKSTQELRGVKDGLESMKATLATTSELVDLPRRMDELKHQVATMGGNLASIQAKAKELEIKTNDAQKRNEIMRQMVERTAGANVLRAFNASLSDLRAQSVSLYRAFYGDDEIGGINGQVQALKGRVDSLFHLVELVQKSSRKNEVKGIPTQTSSSPATTPVPMKPREKAPPLIISAQPLDVTGVVGETTTSSSPASEVDSSRKSPADGNDDLDRVKTLLSAKDES